MAYRLIAIDLDGTLLTKEKNIPQRAKEDIIEASKKGIKVILCTGRTKQGMIRFYKELELDSLMIASGGAEVFDSSEKALFTKYLDPVQAKELLIFAYENGIHGQVYMDDKLMFKERSKYSELYEKRYGRPGLVVPDLLEKEIITPKVLFVAEEERMPWIRSSVNEKFPMLATMRSDPMYLEMTDPAVSKGAGLRFVAGYYGIDRKDIIAVGDSEIDLSMLEIAGLSAVVENAEETAKRHADIICPSNEEAGVADLIEKYFLEAEN